MAIIKINKGVLRTIPWRLVVIFLCFSAAIILSGTFFYKSQRSRIFRQEQNDLTAIASLKVNQIIQWYNERLGDATVIRDNEPLINRIKQYLIDEDKPGLKSELTNWMESVFKEYDYRGILITDTSLKVRLSVSNSDTTAGDAITEELKSVLRNRTIFITDLHRANCINYIHIDILIPLIDRKGSEQKIFGVMILRIDPEIKLFPQIQSWPTPSKSSETLLLRREGDSVLYLNELRHQKNTALNLRLSLADNDLLASKAAMGMKGVFEGIDYRNIPVVGYLTRIGDSKWFMVAKVDKEEIQGPVRRYFIISVIIVLLLILINASVLGFWIWNQQLRSYQNQLLNERYIRESEEKLHESEELFRRLFENMLNGFAYCKMIYKNERPYDFIYLKVNEAFESLTGLKNVEGRKVSDVIPGIQEADPELLERYGRVALNGKPEVFEIYVESLKMWFSISVYSPNKEYFITVFDVITARKLTEETLRSLNEELEQRVIERTKQLEDANRELEAFSYSVSHDLRAPLRSVHGYTKILMEEYENILDDEGKRICGIISSSATQMGGLIDDLLSFSRIGRSSLNPLLLDMKSMVVSVFADICSNEEKSGITLKVGKLHKAYGDASLMRLVWINLISNAIKYSSKENSPEISISSSLKDHTITYLVMDNGVGFDMQYKHKLFGVFQRLHSGSEFEGNGVGLAIVQRIVLKHGGKVKATGEVGKGATFCFSLPVQDKNKATLGTRHTTHG